MEFKETSLYERTKIYRSKQLYAREQAVEEKLREEMENLRAVPEIDAHSRQLAGDRDLSSLPRSLHDWLQMKKTKLHKVRTEALLQEKEASNRPTVRTPKDYAHPIENWGERVTRHLKVRTQTPEPHSHSPNINKTSKKMFKNTHERVEERLLRTHNEKEQRLESYRQKSVFEKPSFTPNTNSYNKPRPQNVTEHLYQEGLVYKKRKDVAAEACIKSACSFKPKINANAESLAAKRKEKAKVEPEESSSVNTKRTLTSVQFKEFLERNYDTVKKKETPSQEETVSSVSYKTHSFRCEMLYERGIKEREIREEYAKIKKLEHQIKEIEECSFKPKITAKAITPTHSATDEKKIEKYSKGDERSTVIYKDLNRREYRLKASFMISNELLETAEDIEQRLTDVLNQMQ